MAVKGKGKQVATDPPGAGGASGSGGKRRKAAGVAGPSSSSAAAAKRRRRSGALQFVDDAAGVDDEYEEEEDESEEDLDDGFFTEEHAEHVSHKRTERSHPLPFLVKEEELSGDELEEFIKNRYSNGVKYAADRNYHKKDDDDMFPMDGALKEPTIWRVKCMVGRERQMAFCFMQKFVDLQRMGTKVPIITAFALDHVRGFVFVEAEKACDVTEACKGFCSVYASRITSVPAAEVPSLLSSRTKPFEISRGTWVRMKNGNYKGDLAQVVSADDGRKRVLIKIIPRVDLHAISKKYGGAISLKEAAVPAPRLISSQELEFFRPHIEMKRDRQTGDVFEVLDGLMFKDGFLYKRVALSSLIYWGIQPTETELLKFSSSPSNRSSADDLDWVSSIYGPKKRNLPKERDVKASSSKMKSSKASNLKASTSTENYDDNDEFNLHDLVLFGRKDFGVVIAVEKDGFKILKGGPEGSAVTLRKQEIKKGCVDKMFTAVDHQKKIISINDTVKVLEGPSQGKQGVVKHLYMGILFIYNESESENCGFFCAQCVSCENIKKRKDMGSSATENLEDNPIPMFSEPTYEHNEHRDSERPCRSTREQLFSIGQMLRIRKGPLKGYLCRVVRIFRNDVTVKLDSLLKIVTVQAEFLSVPANRGDNSSGVPAGNFGSQDTSFFGSEADKTSWDNGLPSFGSDSWQPFSSSTLPIQNADGESKVDPWFKKKSDEDDSDPWGKKTVPSADGDSDPWGKKMVSSADDDTDPWGKKTTSSAVEVWNNSAAQKESSNDNAWDKQAGVGGSDVAGSSWDRAAVNKDSEKSDNWGEACRVADMGTSGNTDPWGSNVKVVDTKETDSWEKATVPPNNKLEGDSQQGWAQPLCKSNENQGKGKTANDADNSGAWDTAVTNRTGSSVIGKGDGDAWVKSDALPIAEDETWGKSKDNNGDGAVGWNEAKSSDKNCGAGGWDTAASNWNKSSAVDEAWGKGKESSANSEERDNGRNDEGSWKSSWGGDNAGRPSWKSDSQVDNEAGDSGGYRGRGRGQYGGRGRGRDNGWRNGDRSNSRFGMESGSGDGPKWGNSGSSDWDKSASNKGSWGGGDNWTTTNPSSSQPWSSSGGTKSYGENQPSTWNSSKDNKPSVGEQNDPWASKVTSTEGREQQNDTWASKMTSTAGAKDSSGDWNAKAKDSSCSVGGKEQETDPWASKVSSTEGADDNNDSWNTKGTPSGSVGKLGNAAPGSSGAEEKADAWSSKWGNDNNKKTDGWSADFSGGNQESSWSKPSFSLEDQTPAWSRPRYGDDNNGNNRGGFGRGNRGRGGRGRSFGDSGSSWNGGNRNDESGGERSEDHWNRRNFDGGRGRGRGRFGRGDRDQGNNFGSGDGGSWGSGRGNSGRGGYRNWNDNNERRPFGQGGDWNTNKGSSEGDQAFSKSKPGWGSDNNDSWGAPKISGGNDQAGKSDEINTWSQNSSSSSILGQPSGNAKDSSAWGAPSDTTTGGGAGGRSWERSNEDSWNPSKRTGGTEKSSWDGSEAAPKKDGEGSGSQGGGGGSSWDKASDGAWNSNKGSDAGSGGW
ncbi:protein RNA-directed DNA methylation 3 [Phragmites australis]|uniref:protein RNA-directed DNA methylation 3 n=1 Tax=Phragmites australis TaxID=29695 RepID=UPI002D79BDD9|nr:protein RNA-directed DNA methylation 3 [Phragmites australis]